MGLAAALPRDWTGQQVYFAITIIISLLGWTELARVVRGRFLSLREEDFVMAAELAGCSQMRIIFRHMVPSFLSHIIAATTLAIPAMIISETSLSFLGLGLRPPAISWGVLLQDAQNVQALAISPWLLIPVIPVIVAMLAFNFLGDGLRDAADPVWMMHDDAGAPGASPAYETNYGIKHQALPVGTRPEDILLQDEGTVKAVDGASASTSTPGKTLGIVGESGLRQERDRPLDPAHRRASRPHRRRRDPAAPRRRTGKAMRPGQAGRRRAGDARAFAARRSVWSSRSR